MIISTASIQSRGENEEKHFTAEAAECAEKNSPGGSPRSPRPLRLDISFFSTWSFLVQLNSCFRQAFQRLARLFLVEGSDHGSSGQFVRGVES
jgi:hypothetical protein